MSRIANILSFMGNFDESPHLGEDIKMVSKRLGHSNVAFTIQTYYHVLSKVERDAVDRFDDILLGKKVKKNCGFPRRS